ncbi:MAG: hypothetical protein RL062_884 [Bacteroidota bacterium]
MWGQWSIELSSDPTIHQTQYWVTGNQRGITRPFINEKTQETWKSGYQWKYQLEGNSEWKSFEGEEVLCMTEVGNFYSKKISKNGSVKLQLMWEKKSGEVDCISSGEFSDDVHPFYDATSKVLVFASNRSEGLGGFDLYKMILTPTGWTIPVRLSAGVNSIRDEKFPILDNGDLYFSTPSEKGDWEIFKSPKSEYWQNRWQMESPINSDHDDFQWIPNGGLSGRLVSNRNATGVNTELYSLQWNDASNAKKICLRIEQPVFCESKEQGTVSEKKEKEFCQIIVARKLYAWRFMLDSEHPAIDMAVTIVDGQGHVIAVLHTNSQGEIAWEYLPFEFSGLQWWKDNDQSQLLASNEPVFIPEVNISDSTEIFFDNGSALINEKAQHELMQLAFYLLLHGDKEVWIVGSADAKGNYGDNEKLAWERAWKVQNFLLAHGVLVDQMNVDIADPIKSRSKEGERKVSLAIR